METTEAAGVVFLVVSLVDLDFGLDELVEVGVVEGGVAALTGATIAAIPKAAVMAVVM